MTSEEFMLQGRTAQALTSEGNKTKATVFAAFVAQETAGGSKFQVELDDDLESKLYL